MKKSLKTIALLHFDVYSKLTKVFSFLDDNVYIHLHSKSVHMYVYTYPLLSQTSIGHDQK